MLRRVRRARTGCSDAGFTLVELLVSTLLFGLVLAVAGALLLNGLKGQRDVVGTGQASNDAQVAISSMERAIRNASTGGVKVENGKLLVFTDLGDAAHTRECLAWIYVQPPSGTPGRIYFKKGPTFPLPLDVEFEPGWTLAVDGVLPLGGPIFTESVDATGLKSVSIAFESKRINQKKDGVGVVLKTTVRQRPQALSGGCS